MKKLVVLIFCISVHSSIFSQVIHDIDNVFPYHENLAAIKKGNQWGFIDREGLLVIDFRDDIVSSKIDDLNVYPIFAEGKCLIKKKIDGVYYYGYINLKGETTIAPKYLNATNFKNNYAIVIELGKNVVGKNVLGNEIVQSRLEESIINDSGKIIKFLDNSRGYVASKQPPNIESNFIAPHLVKVKTKNNKWAIHKF